MMATAAALAIGIVGCSKTPNGGDPIQGEGSQTGMQLSIIMPSTGGSNTRGVAEGNVVGTTAENEVKTVQIFGFSTAGIKAEFGGYTQIAFSSSGGSATFTEDTAWATANPGQGKKWNLVTPIDATAGAMKIYVGINVPGVSASGFATETDLLDYVRDVSAMSDVATTGITMFSNVQTPTLVAVLPGAPIPASNTVNADTYRVVSKIVASTPSGKGVGANLFTSSWTKTDLDAAGEDATGITNAGIDLKYSVSHWRVFQNAVQSWVPAHYALPEPAAGVRPVTYKGVNAINSYGKSLYPTANPELTFFTQASASATDPELASATSSQYIGENVSATGSPNNVTTYVYISTKLTLNGKAAWDASNPKRIVWTTVSEWGGTSSPKDIYLLYHNGTNRYYFTDTAADAQGIIDGVFNDGLTQYNVRIIPETGVDPTPTLPGTPMKKSDFIAAHPELVVDQFIYPQGYVHFYAWINKTGTNMYDIMRNQFIHLNITGIKAANVAVHKFAGNPSQDPLKFYKNDGTLNTTATVAGPDANPGIVKYPIDLFSDAGPNPLIPGENIDPEQTSMLVNVAVRNWTYKATDLELEH